jgi:hypothetical protein
MHACPSYEWAVWSNRNTKRGRRFLVPTLPGWTGSDGAWALLPGSLCSDRFAGRCHNKKISGFSAQCLSTGSELSHAMACPACLNKSCFPNRKPTVGNVTSHTPRQWSSSLLLLLVLLDRLVSLNSSLRQVRRVPSIPARQLRSSTLYYCGAHAFLDPILRLAHGVRKCVVWPAAAISNPGQG